MVAVVFLLSSVSHTHMHTHSITHPSDDSGMCRHAHAEAVWIFVYGSKLIFLDCYS